MNSLSQYLRTAKLTQNGGNEMLNSITKCIYIQS